MKVLIFRKGGTLQRNLVFMYEDQPIEIGVSSTWALYLPQGEWGGGGGELFLRSANYVGRTSTKRLYLN